MKEIIGIIEQLIAEHKGILKDARSLEKAANDASILVDLEKAKENFVPGRFDQKQTLQKLQESMETIAGEVDAHFNREETEFLAAIEQHGDRKIVTALNSLLLEHKDLRNRLGHSKQHIAELVSGGLASHRWAASAHDMRTYLSNTRKLLEAHAAIENELFAELMKHLKSK